MKSMKHEFMAAAAALALVAGTGGAFAQSPQTPKVDQGQVQPGGSAPAPMQNRDDAPNTGLDARGGSQAQTPGGKVDTKTQGGAQVQGTSPGGGGTGVQTKDSAGQPDRDGRTQAQDRDRPGQKQDTARDSKPGDTERVQLNEQQRSRISQTIKTENRNLRRVERTNINFNINVGGVVPRTIELYPLPAPIVSVVPAYRGYLYILVGDDLLIIHPRTYEIVAVIPA